MFREPDFDPDRASSVVDERMRVLELLRKHGFNTTSFQVLEDGLSYWWDSDDACVAYADTGTAWVAAGAPLASAPNCGAVALRFVDAATRAGRRALFFASQERLAGIPGLVSVQVGLQPVWDPRNWQATAQNSKSLRYQFNRARAKGVSVRRVESSELTDPASPIRIAIERTIRRWLGTRRMSPMAFLVHVQPFSFATERRVFVALRASEVVGFVSAVPVYTRAGWFLEDLIRDPAAPNGTMELLVDAAMQQAASEGSTWATLGLVPLAGPVPDWMRRIGAVGKPLYDFAGLHAFKAKLAPHAWEPIYLTHPPDVPTPTAVIDALRAFAGGGLSSFVVRTLIEGPSLVLWTLAILLVPWTLALGLVDAARWFPSELIRDAWIGFDVLVIVAMMLLANRFRPRLALVLAIAVSTDAALSLLQAIMWNAPRIRGVLDAVIVVCGCAAPLFASAVLWRGVHRERTRVH